jgi:dTDP-4-dehydrorhamnose 3,5-epimerase
MEVIQTSLPDAMVIVPSRYADDRGFFSETYSRRALAKAGIVFDFVQDNHAYSVRRGTIRGLHFQIPPFAQDKIVRVVRGAVLDVVVDLRHGSPTFGKHESVVLSAKEWKQLFVPEGFAHGLCTLEPDTEVIYKVSNYYSPAHDKGVRWNDPAIGIEWPVSPEDAILSPKDQSLPLFAALPHYFTYSCNANRREAASA